MYPAWTCFLGIALFNGGLALIGQFREHDFYPTAAAGITAVFFLSLAILTII